MGFSQHQYGNIHPCWVKDGYVFQESSCTHEVYAYPTRLNVNLERQTNIFMSFTVAFLLYDEEKMYVGRHDGCISIYRLSDNMLVGLSNWDAPNAPLTTLVGFFNSPLGIREVLLDTRDRQTVYVNWHRTEAALEKKYAGDYTDMFDADALAPAVDLDGWKFYTMGGEPIGVNVWSVQDALWKQNCRVFL